MATNRPRKPTTPAPLAEPRPTGQPSLADAPAAPLFVPQGVDLELVPHEVRQAVTEVVQPVYQRLVLEADDPLERSLGVTLAHLLWLEILQQFDLKREYTQISAVLGVSGNVGGAIDQHLRIIQSKVQVGYLLARLQHLRRQWLERTQSGSPKSELGSREEGAAGEWPVLGEQQ